MFKAFVFLFWIGFFAAVIVGLVWFYEQNSAFEMFVDEIWGDFKRVFQEKIHI